MGRVQDNKSQLRNIVRPESSQPIPKHAKCVFRGKIHDVYQWEQVMYDGTTETFEKIKRADSVGVIPITDEGKILLAKQEQPGSTPFVGIIGGRIDSGEDPLEACKRELMEEAGIEAGELEIWYAEQFLGKIDWAVYTYVAKRCKVVRDPQLDSGEKIELFEVSVEEFIDIVAQDNFRDWDVALKVLKAKEDQEKMLKLKNLLGNN